MKKANSMLGLLLGKGLKQSVFSQMGTPASHGSCWRYLGRRGCSLPTKGSPHFCATYLANADTKSSMSDPTAPHREQDSAVKITTSPTLTPSLPPPSNALLPHPKLAQPQGLANSPSTCPTWLPPGAPLGRCVSVGCSPFPPMLDKPYVTFATPARA